MNTVLLLFALVANAHMDFSYYTYHKVGSYSVSDFCFRYGLRRYDLRLTLEQRQQQSGLKSITLEIDSVLSRYRLALGESSYHITAPVSTYFNLWGLVLKSRDLDLFLGKQRDNTSAVPPTFEGNKYTLGARLHGQLSYRVPIDFYLLARQDSASLNRIGSNRALGANSEFIVGKRLSVGSQVWVSHTGQGLGASLAINSHYTRDNYGGHFYFTTMTHNYVSPSSAKANPGTWVRLTSYQKPANWLEFSQDLSYASLYDSRLVLNTRVERPRFPAVTYSVSFSRDLISQVANGEWYYKDFVGSVNYEWSKNGNAYGAQLAQRIVNCQIWTAFQHRGLNVWQFGFMFPFPKYIRFKGFLNYATRQDYVSHTTGFELSSRFLRDLCLNMTYEFIRNDAIGDHFISLSVSKSFDFEQVGLSFVSGRVFMDVNSNGFFDVGDRPVADVGVVLDGRNEIKTDKSGHYIFSFVKTGAHSLGVKLGSVPAEIGTAVRTLNIDTELFSQRRIDFPLEVLGSVSGIVYFDADNSGQMEEDEAGVPNVVLALNGYLTMSDKDGRFRFANLASGTYTLEPKILPPETTAAKQELLYVYIQPGSHFSDYRLGIVKEQRPVKKKIFD